LTLPQQKQTAKPPKHRQENTTKHVVEKQAKSLREGELSIAMPPRREATFTSAANAKQRTEVFQPNP
jgi:hypothetical protein